MLGALIGLLIGLLSTVVHVVTWPYEQVIHFWITLGHTPGSGTVTGFALFMFVASIVLAVVTVCLPALIFGLIFG